MKKIYLSLSALALSLSSIAQSDFVLNTSLKDLYTPVLRNQTYFNLMNDGKSLADKQIIMIDEHQGNTQLADKIKETNKE